jgi:hypothetical protein
MDHSEEKTVLPLFIEVNECGEDGTPIAVVDLNVSDILYAKGIKTAQPKGGTLIAWASDTPPLRVAEDVEFVRAKIRAALREARVLAGAPTV